MKSRLLIAILATACAASTQTLRVVPATLDAIVPIPNTIQFFCTQDYQTSACVNDARALQHVLMPYPIARLGTWSFVLVPADNWRELLHGLHGDAASPAFSIIDQHMTVLESSLFKATPIRDKSFLRTFGVIGGALLDLAVTHELGHAICQEQDQHRADAYGRELRQTRNVDCGETPDGRSKIRLAFHLSQTDARPYRQVKHSR